MRKEKTGRHPDLEFSGQGHRSGGVRKTQVRSGLRSGCEVLVSGRVVCVNVKLCRAQETSPRRESMSRPGGEDRGLGDVKLEASIILKDTL